MKEQQYEIGALVNHVGKRYHMVTGVGKVKGWQAGVYRVEFNPEVGNLIAYLEDDEMEEAIIPHVDATWSISLDAECTNCGRYYDLYLEVENERLPNIGETTSIDPITCRCPQCHTYFAVDGTSY